MKWRKSQCSINLKTIERVRILRKQELYMKKAKKLPSRLKLGKDYCTRKNIVHLLFIIVQLLY